ncbi:MAG: type VI secretion system tube protein Hcp [Isosphaeraceae bacterium]
MIRSRAQNRTIAHVESLEGRQLLTSESLIHIGALTGTALTDFRHGKTPTSDGWIPINSFTVGVANPTGAGSTRESLSQFNVSLKVGRGSETLLEEAPIGRAIPQVEVAFIRNSDSPTDIVEYDFKNVLVLHFKVNAAPGGSIPTESVSFAFSSFAISYSLSARG